MSASFEIEIQGMSCGHCVKTIREALGRVEGVTVRDVVIGRAVIDLDERAASPQDVENAIDETGFVFVEMSAT